MRACSSRGWRRSRPRSSPRCPRSPCAPARSTSVRGSRTPTAPPSLLADVAANVTGGVNQYPPGLGVAALRTAVAEHQKRFYGLDVDPDHVLVTDRGDGGDRVGGAGAVRARATRSSPSSPTTTRTPRRSRCPARRCGPSRCGRRPSPSTRTSCAPRSRPRTRVVLVNTPHNPTGKVFSRERADAASASWPPSTTRSSSPTRCTSTWSSTGSSTSRWRRCPGSRDRTLTISSAGKTFSVTGLEGRLGARPDRAGRRRCRAVKQFLTYVSGAPVPAGARHRARRCPTPSSTTSPATLPASATCSSRVCATAGFTRVPAAAARTSSSTDVAPLGFDDGAAFCWRAAGAGRGRGRAGVGVLRRPGLGPDAGALRVLQARRGADRGRVTACLAADPDLRGVSALTAAGHERG